MVVCLCFCYYCCWCSWFPPPLPLTSHTCVSAGAAPRTPFGDCSCPGIHTCANSRKKAQAPGRRTRKQNRAFWELKSVSWLMETMSQVRVEVIILWYNPDNEWENTTHLYLSFCKTTTKNSIYYSHYFFSFHRKISIWYVQTNISLVDNFSYPQNIPYKYESFINCSKIHGNFALVW